MRGFSLLLVLFGCGESHVSSDAGLDARDAFAFDSSADASAPDGGSDVGPIALTSCEGELDAMAGEGCFCQGAIAVVGDIAYRVGFELEVFDISGEVERVATAPLARPGSEGSVVVDGDSLFIGDWGLEMFDISTPRSPRSIAVVDIEGSVSDMVLVGSRLWVATDEAEVGWLRSFDVSDPARPVAGDSIRLEGNPGSVIRYGEQLVVLEERRFGEEGTDIAAIINLGSSRVENRIPLEGRAVLRRRGAISNDSLFVVGVMPVLQVVDLRGERVIATLDAPEDGSGVAMGIAVSDDGLAFVSGSGIQVAYVSNPESPRWLGSLDVPNDTHHLERRGDTLFVGTGSYFGRVPFTCR